MGPFGFDHDKSCFVAMPYETKQVDGEDIDFDWIYDHVFTPAIESVDAGDGEKLRALRQDRTYAPTMIHPRMIDHLRDSALVLVDITGDLPNVMVELGVRIGTDNSGTVIVGQKRGQVMFNLIVFQVVRYDHRSQAAVEKSIASLREKLAIALDYSRKNVPLLGARREISARRGTPQQPTELGHTLDEADDAMRAGNWDVAQQKFGEAAAMLPNNPLLHQLCGIALRFGGHLDEATRAFEHAVRVAPDYVDAHRELGTTASEVYRRSGDEHARARAESALTNAVRLSATEGPARLALGNLLEKTNRAAEALELFEQARTHFTDNTQLLNRIATLKRGLVHSDPRLPERTLLIVPARIGDRRCWQLEVSGLPRTTTADEIERVMKPYVQLRDVDIYGGGAGVIGRGYVDLDDPSALGKLADGLHNQSHFGGRIHVDVPGGNFGGGNFGGGGFGGLGPGGGTGS